MNTKYIFNLSVIIYFRFKRTTYVNSYSTNYVHNMIVFKGKITNTLIIIYCFHQCSVVTVLISACFQGIKALPRGHAVFIAQQDWTSNCPLTPVVKPDQSTHAAGRRPQQSHHVGWKQDISEIFLLIEGASIASIFSWKFNRKKNMSLPLYLHLFFFFF